MAETNPGEKLIRLYSDLALARLTRVVEVASPSQVMEEAIAEYGQEGIDTLDEATLAEIGRNGLHAYVAKTAEESSRKKLTEEVRRAEWALMTFVGMHYGSHINVQQVEHSYGSGIYLANGEWARQARGRLAFRSATYPQENLCFYRRGRLFTDQEHSIARVLRSDTLEPQITVEFL